MEILPINSSIFAVESSLPGFSGVVRQGIVLATRDRESSLFHRLLAFATVSVLIVTMASGSVVRAQDDDFDDEEEEADVATEVNMFPMENFDQWVFQGDGGEASGARKRLASLLALHVDSIGQICDLSETQKQKLRLAGRGDIKRVFESVEKSRRKILALKNDQNKVNQAWQFIQPLQKKISGGVFDEKSLLHKIRARTLHREQIAKYEKVEAERRRFRYEASVGIVVATLERGMPLREEQRQKFVKLLLEETRPPKTFGQYGYYVVMCQAGKIPEKKIKPIFDDAQWRALSKRLNQMRGMEGFLRQKNLIP